MFRVRTLSVLITKGKFLLKAPVRFIPYEENDEEHYGKCGRHVDDLPCGLDRFKDAEVDDDPRDDEENEELPSDAAHVGDGVGHAQDA